MNVMRAYTFRMYPTKRQAAVLQEQLETHRHLYNAALTDRDDSWKSHRESVSYRQQNLGLTLARQYSPWLARCNSNALQRTLRRLDHAFQAFFRRVKGGAAEPGYPRFIRFGEFHTMEFTYRTGLQVAGDGGRVYVQFACDLKARHTWIPLRPPVPAAVLERAAIKTGSVVRQADGYYLHLACIVEMNDPEPSALPAVGLALDREPFMSTSDGVVVERPRYYERGEAKLRRAQRRLARRQKGGKRREKARQLVAKHHQHVARQRQDFHHKQSRSLAEAYGLIVHEDLALVPDRVQASDAKQVHDAGYGQFLGFLAYKTAERGGQVREVPLQEGRRKGVRAAQTILTAGERLEEQAQAGPSGHKSGGGWPENPHPSGRDMAQHTRG